MRFSTQATATTLAIFCFAADVSAQARMQSLAVEVGWTRDQVVEQYGTPISSANRNGFEVLAFEVSPDLGIGRPNLNQDVARAFPHRRLYLALRDRKVYTTLAVLESYQFEEAAGFYRSARSKRVEQYGRSPDEGDSTTSMWIIPYLGRELGLRDFLMITGNSERGIYSAFVSVSDLTYPNAFDSIIHSNAFEKH